MEPDLHTADMRNRSVTNYGTYKAMCGAIVAPLDIAGYYYDNGVCIVGHAFYNMGKDSTCLGCVLLVFEELAKKRGT